MKSKSKIDIWKDIQEFYLKLREWYENRNIYHKVGYLIAQGAEMQELINESVDQSKSEFNKSLDEKITNTLDITRDQLLGLSYDKSKDRSKIESILLLLNVESVRLLQDSTEKYSFKHHKLNSWSLEHIHAQNSEGLNKKEDQQLWLQLHKKSLQLLINNNINQDKAGQLINKIEDNYEDITKEIFDSIFSEVVSLLSMEEDRSYGDSVSNMALLSIENNAALNNSTFDVKRNRILEKDRKGEYIPICTRRVFLKYYSNSDNNHLQFWGEEDRSAYINAMIGTEGILIPYLKPTEKPE
jgi:hypothetical protein